MLVGDYSRSQPWTYPWLTLSSYQSTINMTRLSHESRKITTPATKHQSPTSQPTVNRDSSAIHQPNSSHSSAIRHRVRPPGLALQTGQLWALLGLRVADPTSAPPTTLELDPPRSYSSLSIQEASCMRFAGSFNSLAAARQMANFHQLRGVFVVTHQSSPGGATPGDCDSLVNITSTPILTNKNGQIYSDITTDVHQPIVAVILRCYTSNPRDTDTSVRMLTNPIMEIKNALSIYTTNSSNSSNVNL